jgi:hypothetical protein
MKDTGENTMIKIALLGDSIRMQYEPLVRQMLEGEFEVVAPEENCRFSKYMLRGMFDWRELMEGCRIVHFNAGHWDLNDLGFGLFTSEAEYIENITRIADILKERHGKVIFATTTPTRLSNTYNKNDVIKRFNEIAVKVLSERGVLINDLNSPLVSDIDRYICEDTIHLTEEGKAICAERVANIIRDVARELSEMSENDKGTAPGDGVGAPVII